GFAIPDEVSLWVMVTKSYFPVFKALSTSSGFVALPISASKRSVSTLLLIPISYHLLPNAPIENTAALLAVQDLIAPSNSPVPEDVDNRICSFVFHIFCMFSDILF